MEPVVGDVFQSQSFLSTHDAFVTVCVHIFTSFVSLCVCALVRMYQKLHSLFSVDMACSLVCTCAQTRLLSFVCMYDRIWQDRIIWEYGLKCCRHFVFMLCEGPKAETVPLCFARLRKLGGFTLVLMLVILPLVHENMITSWLLYYAHITRNLSQSSHSLYILISKSQNFICALFRQSLSLNSPIEFLPPWHTYYWIVFTCCMFVF